MADVGISAHAFLALMPVRGHLIRALDQPGICIWPHANDEAEETSEKVTAVSAGRRGRCRVHEDILGRSGQGTPKPGRGCFLGRYARARASRACSAPSSVSR